MKKILLAAALMSISAVSSFALSITQNCTVLDQNATAGNGAGNVSCPGFFSVLPGGAINITYVMAFTVDYSFNGFDVPVPNFAFSINSPGTGLDVPSTSLPTNQRNQVTTLGPIATTGSDATYFAPFTTAVAFTSAGVLNGVFDIRYTVNYDIRSTGGEVPEPSTVALMGAGLVGVVAFARRKRS